MQSSRMCNVRWWQQQPQQQQRQTTPGHPRFSLHIRIRIYYRLYTDPLPQNDYDYFPLHPAHDRIYNSLYIIHIPKRTCKTDASWRCAETKRKYETAHAQHYDGHQKHIYTIWNGTPDRVNTIILIGPGAGQPASRSRADVYVVCGAKKYAKKLRVCVAWSGYSHVARVCVFDIPLRNSLRFTWSE